MMTLKELKSVVKTFCLLYGFDDKTFEPKRKTQAEEAIEFFNTQSEILPEYVMARLDEGAPLMRGES